MQTFKRTIAMMRQPGLGFRKTVTYCQQCHTPMFDAHPLRKFCKNCKESRWQNIHKEKAKQRSAQNYAEIKLAVQKREASRIIFELFNRGVN